MIFGFGVISLFRDGSLMLSMVDADGSRCSEDCRSSFKASLACVSVMLFSGGISSSSSSSVCSSDE